MRNSLILFFLIASFSSFSQAVPQKINYQGVARHADGTPITNKTIALRFRLLQGSPGGSAVFTENQSVATGSFGVFSSQIGSVNSLSVVTWSNGPFFLEVAIDTNNTSSFIVMGTQELVSVPYALYAGSAPSPSLSFNPGTSVLNVGTNTVALPSGSSQSTTINGSGAISTTLTGTSYNVYTPSVSVVASQLSPGVAAGMAQVLGSFPNYSIMVAPVIAYNPTVGVLQLSSFPLTSPSYNYTYDITPNLAITGNTLSVGPPSNSITIPVSAGAPNTTITSSGGLISISSPVTNSFNINVQPVSIGVAGSASIQGTYPNFTVSAPANLNPVSITQSGAITTTGSYPNFTVSTPSVSVSSSPVSIGNVTGFFPNYVVDVTPNFSYNNPAGALVVSNSASPAVSYTYNVTQNLQFSGGVLTSGPASNSVSIPSAVTPSIIGVNAASVTSTGSSYTVSVPVTTLTGMDGAVVSGSAPNFTISAPQSSVTGDGAATVTSSGNTYTVSVPVTTLVGTGGAVVSGSAPNFTVDAPLATSVSGSGAASVSSSGNNYTVSVPVTSVTGTGGAVVTGSAPNFIVNAPSAASITGIGSATVTGSAPNFTINTPAKVSLTGGALIYPSGLLQIMGSYPSYSLLVAPSIAYSQSTGFLTLSNQPFTTPTYNYSYDITPALTKTNNVIQAGPSTNTIVITSPAAQAFAVSGSAVLIAGGSVLMSTSFTKQSASSEIDVFVHTQASTGISLGNFTFDIVIDGNASTVSTNHTIGGNTTDYISLKAIFAGLSAGSHTVGIKATPSGLGVLTTLNPNAYSGAKLILKEVY